MADLGPGVRQAGGPFSSLQSGVCGGLRLHCCEQAEWEGDAEAPAAADESADPIAKGHVVIADLCGEGEPPNVVPCPVVPMVAKSEKAACIIAFS